MLVAQTVEKVTACGPPGEQGWLCPRVFDLTGNQTAANLAEAFEKPLAILLVLVIAYLAVRVTRFMIRRIVRNLQREGVQRGIRTLRRRTGLALLDTGGVSTAHRIQRAETLGLVLRSVSSLVIWAIAVVVVLSMAGLALAPLLAGAGVAGVALGFGAQSVVRDFLAGTFIILEDQYGVGDFIDAGEAIGTVEGVSLRTTRVRDIEGVLWHVPNGEIKRVGNKTQKWSRAVLDIGVSYDTDIDEATAVIKDAADALWREPEWADFMLEEPDVPGVEALAADRVTIRVLVKTKPREQWKVARELRARIKTAFDEAGIAMPIPSQTITYRRAGGPPPPVATEGGEGEDAEGDG